MPSVATSPELTVPDVTSAAKPRVLSGIQPTADSFHFGNYLGATRQWVDLQREYQPFFFIADLHAHALRMVPEANLLAVASPTPGKARRFADERKIPHAFTDYREQRPGAVHHIKPSDLPPPYATKSVDNGPSIIDRPAKAWPQAPAPAGENWNCTELTSVAAVE